MTAAKKFTFDTVFDSGYAMPKPIQPAEPDAAKAAEEAEPEAPTFSEADLAAAREEARAQGHAEGVAAQADAVEAQIISLLGTAETRLGELFTMEANANEERTRYAVAVAVTIVRKLFPHLQDSHGQNEVESLVLRTLGEIAEEPKVTISVNPDMLDALRARMDGITAQSRFEGLIDLQADETLAPSDCHLVWSHGGVKRDASELWQRVDEIIERNLGTPPIPENMTERMAESEEDTPPADATHTPDGDTPTAAAADADAAPNAGDDNG